MIKQYPASSRYSFDKGWLRGNYSFSFSDYEDPNNTSFGPLRVCNDDTIAAASARILIVIWRLFPSF
jgi:redox-sensitive bicupin YhaK (pirin superfamily)